MIFVLYVRTYDHTKQLPKTTAYIGRPFLTLSAVRTGRTCNKEGLAIYLEITTGKDSFRAQGASSRRNVQVTSYVRVKDDGEGKQIIPLFAAYQRKLKGFKDHSLIQTIPATAAHGPNIGGVWFTNRQEVLPGTEILLEYRRRDSTPGSFGEEVEYNMLIADPNAPLYQMRLELPHHHLSAVPYIFTIGRFDVLKSDDQLPEHSPPIWKDFLNLDEEFEVAHLMDPLQEKHFWTYDELEARIKQTERLERVEQSDGKKRIKIRRSRRIKTR